MGVVYRAHDRRLLRKVALKLIPDHLADEQERRARIVAEARAASALSHPGIAAIYEIGEDGGQLFIVMELVVGDSLRSVIRQRAPLSPTFVARIGAELAAVLDCAHQQGVVHGDVKPENVVLHPDGRVKLLDFGLSRRRVVETLSTLTAVPEWLSQNQPAGTLAYMAPEQLRGQPSSELSDLYSLGVLLYEAAAGCRPFPGEKPESLIPLILNSPAPAVREMNSSVPLELAGLVMRLLAKDPASRPKSAGDVRIDLQNFVRNQESGRSAEVPRTEQSIAVLPFKLLTPDPALEYLGAALADSVIHSLSVTGKALVRPLSTVLQYGTQMVDPAVALRELNVDIVVDGTIQQFGERIRVMVQGLRAATQAAIFAEKLEAHANDLFSLQDELGEQVRERLGLRSGSTEEVERPTKNPVAFELYLRAAERLAKLNRWDVRTAIEMLENATKLDPKFAGAWARMAEACVLMSVSFEPGPMWTKRAEQATRKALALDAANAAAHCVRGQLLWTPAKRFQNTPALRALQAALRLNPGNHRARQWQCLIFLHVGLLAEAKKGLRTVLSTMPDDVFTLVFLGQTAMYAGDYDLADEYNGRALALDRTHIWPNCFYPTIFLYKNELERAERQMVAARQVLPNDSWLRCCESLLWAKRGESKKAEKMLDKALSDNNLLLHTHHMWHTAAVVYTLLGRQAKAIPLLERCDKLGLPNYNLFLDDPHLGPLQEHARFQTLLKKMKREWKAYEKEFGQER